MTSYYLLEEEGTNILFPMMEDNINSNVAHNINYKCLCGSEEFNVFHSDEYETSARCIQCNRKQVVHSG